jgi:hypothetical protein
MISNNLISRDEGEEYLEDLRGMMPKNTQSSNINNSFIIDDDIGVEEETQLAQVVTEPTRSTKPLQTANINPNLLAQAPTGVASLQSGLTPTESAFLREDEKVLKLRERGLA